MEKLQRFIDIHHSGNQSRFAEKAGLSNASISRILSGEQRDITALTIAKIEDATAGYITLRDWIDPPAAPPKKKRERRVG
jgi:DNA-binding transcriptional regulator YdaS (Cro superfamily)